MMRRLVAATALLVLPLALLLFAQWPLRNWVQAGSREANDFAQVLFALYSAVAVTAASRAGTHLCAHTGPPARWRAWAVLACVAPWGLFLLWTSAAPVWNSIASAERFPESFNPGFFLVKACLWVLAVLALIDAAWRAFKPDDLHG